MPLTPSISPITAQTAFTAGIAGFLSGTAGIGTPDFVGGTPAIPSPADVDLNVVSAMPLYVLRLSAAAAATSSISPSMVGWMYYAGNPAGAPPVIVKGTVARRPPTQDWKLINVSYGPLVFSEMKSVEALLTTPQIIAEDYEARMLLIPGINLRTHWAVAKKPGLVDWLTPIPAGLDQLIPALQGTTAYDLPNFLSIIHPLVAANVNMAPGYGA